MENLFGKSNRSFWMGIAMLEVIFLHLVFQRGSEDFLFPLLKMMFLQGDLGVNIFILFSAYGLSHSLTNNSLISFYKRRILRIFPIYLFYLIIIQLFVTSNSGVFPFLVRLLGLDMFRSWENLGDVWYMSALILIYSFFPIIFKFTIQLARKGWIYIWIFIVMLTIAYYCPGIHSYLRGMFHARLYLVILGIALYFYHKNDDNASIWKLLSMTAVLTAFTYNDCSFYFYLPLVLYSICTVYKTIPSSGFISFVGRHSLEIYLGQAIGLQVLFCNKLNGNYYFDALISLAISFILAVVFGYLQAISQKLIYRFTK